MKILYLMCFLILVSSCTTKFNNSPNVVYKYIEKPVYVKCKYPDLPKKPNFIDYNIFRIKYENKYYYCADYDNAKILITNWLNYKNWCENIYNQINNRGK